MFEFGASHKAGCYLIENKDMVAGEGVEPRTPAFSGLCSLNLNPFSINNLIRQDGRFIVTTL